MMSKLAKLIAELCPEGVEYKKLGEICETITKGTTPKSYEKSGVSFIKTESFDGYSINKQKLVYVSKETHECFLKRSILKENDILFAIAGSIGKCLIVKKDILPANTNQALAIIRLKDNVDFGFVFYFLQSQSMTDYIAKSVKGSAQPNLNLQQINNVLIPVPPLPVQNEIVRILDNFTELTAELKLQLTAELTARKKQYEYYRVKLLTFGDEIERVSIGDICDVLTGGEAPENTIKGDVSDESHPYPVFGNGKEVYGYTDSYRVDKDAVVISSIGANTGAVYYRKAFFTPIIRLKVIVPKTSEISNRYLFHAVSITSFSSKSSSVPNMNANDIKKAIIPLPPFEVQERLAYILDQFDAFCTDLNEGLPAEIAARTKQYEYYRDKLLTFPERA